MTLQRVSPALHREQELLSHRSLVKIDEGEDMPLLRIENLHASVGEQKILQGVNLEVDNGETHVLMGPNASGKTTLVLTLIGYPAYKVTKGRILFDGKDVSSLRIDERVRLGIGVTFQHSPAIRGVKLRSLLRLCAGLESWNPSKEPCELFATKILKEVGMDPRLYLNRDINVGFSGGEKKRIEVAQIFALRPRLMIFDEPDSGVDIDSLKLIGNGISSLATELRSATIVITHYRHIIPYIKPKVVHVLYNGKIVNSGNPNEIVKNLEKLGYEGYIRNLADLEGQK